MFSPMKSSLPCGSHQDRTCLGHNRTQHSRNTTRAHFVSNIDQSICKMLSLRRAVRTIVSIWHLPCLEQQLVVPSAHS